MEKKFDDFVTNQKSCLIRVELITSLSLSHVKGQLAQDLANQLKSKINQTSKFNGCFQTQLLDLLDRHHKVFSIENRNGLKR